MVRRHLDRPRKRKHQRNAHARNTRKNIFRGKGGPRPPPEKRGRDFSPPQIFGPANLSPIRDICGVLRVLRCFAVPQQALAIRATTASGHKRM